MSVETTLLYSLVSPDESTLFAQAENWNGLLCAARTLRDEGYDVDSMVVEKAGRYDGQLTAAIQEDIA